MTSPFLPSSFTYGDAPQGGVVMPIVIAPRNPSNTIDTQYAAGYLWLSSLDQYYLNSVGARVYGSGNLYYQAGNSSGTPSWVLISDSSGSIVGVTGTANQITVSISSGVATLSIPSTFIAPGSIAATTTVTAGTNLALNGVSSKVSINASAPATASIGTSAAMTAGTITVASTAVSASSIIFVSHNTLAGTPGAVSAPAASRVAGVSFDIVSSSNTDISTVNYWIVN